MFSLQMLFIALRIPFIERPSNYNHCKSCVNVSTVLWNTWNNTILMCDVKVTKKAKIPVSDGQTAVLICAFPPFIAEEVEGGRDTMCVQCKDSSTGWDRERFGDEEFLFPCLVSAQIFGFLFKVPILRQNEITK